MAFTISTGVAVGAVAPAVREGLSSPAGSRLLRAVVVVGLLFAGQQTLTPIREAIVDLLGRAFRRQMFRRTIAVTLEPATIAHLEDPKYKDMLTKVKSPKWDSCTIWALLSALGQAPLLRPDSGFRRGVTEPGILLEPVPVRAAAAKVLGIQRTYLLKLIKALGIE